MKAAPRYAQAMSKMSNLAEINVAMKSVPVEAVPVPVPVVTFRRRSAPASRSRG